MCVWCWSDSYTDKLVLMILKKTTKKIFCWFYTQLWQSLRTHNTRTWTGGNQSIRQSWTNSRKKENKSLIICKEMTSQTIRHFGFPCISFFIKQIIPLLLLPFHNWLIWHWLLLSVTFILIYPNWHFFHWFFPPYSTFVSTFVSSFTFLFVNLFFSTFFK